MKTRVGVLVPMVAVAIALAWSRAGPPRLPPAPLPATYEITWYSVNPVTDAPSTASMILVLSATALDSQFVSRMQQATPRPRTSGMVRACWRVTSGTAAMNSATFNPYLTDWDSVGAGRASLTLWFHIDAGATMTFRLNGDSLEGQVRSSGWMGPNGAARPRTLVDRAVGRRIGEPDARRCFS